jgi:DUF2933 family protein
MDGFEVYIHAWDAITRWATLDLRSAHHLWPYPRLLAPRRSRQKAQAGRRAPRISATYMTHVRSFLGSMAGLITCLVAAALGIYLLVFHLAHVVLVVPYLALMACPLMHLMHRGHHHHGARNANPNKT